MPPNVPPVPLAVYCLLRFSGVLGVAGGSKRRHALKESCRSMGCGSVTNGPGVVLLLVGVLNNREAMAPSPSMGWTLDTGSGLAVATDPKHYSTAHEKHSLPPGV